MSLDAHFGLGTFVWKPVAWEFSPVAGELRLTNDVRQASVGYVRLGASFGDFCLRTCAWNFSIRILPLEFSL